ncbi:Type II toxin-antitoxin system VapC family toxin [Rhodovastum atsumiense]|uniref:Type II toxin-antitoxin system VapC family toxin n=1 Tax=Rhodovastum atsumiense TaxID=504468 RepID=A0A5M6ILF0_9PROT|nr:type II toxin-antitoxin system VapC family toxin [Rhodovastum atsumiense]KAA5609100.1 type II toxin-antitoxin system VapC family toxin [Rhodovastum atsumiense]CAH2603769.1 Type II toxin-antitoxin system VapC family toxin [Rhodovastum atsumiense]
MADGTLIDTNVLLDLVTDDPTWAGWSVQQLDAAALRGKLLINDIVYAELSVRFGRIENLEALVDEAGLIVTPIPRPALFLAAKAFQRYRAAGGTRTGVLPDFFIGAHAAVAGLPLLTRDPQRFRTHYPTVALITPQDSPR